MFVSFVGDSQSWGQRFFFHSGPSLSPVSEVSKHFHKTIKLWQFFTSISWLHKFPSEPLCICIFSHKALLSTLQPYTGEYGPSRGLQYFWPNKDRIEKKHESIKESQRVERGEKTKTQRKALNKIIQSGFSHPEPPCPLEKVSPSDGSHCCSEGRPLTPLQMSQPPENTKTHTSLWLHGYSWQTFYYDKVKWIQLKIC